MAVSTRLDLRQSQTLVMTPQLQQAIKLLQLSNIELSEFVDQELERNPLLERADGEDAPPAEAPSEAAREDGQERLLDSVGSESTGGEAPLDISSQDAYGADDAGSGSDAAGPADFDGGVAPWGKGGGDHDEDSGVERAAAGPLTLRDHLSEQIQIDIDDPTERMIGAYLIDMVDEAGYLRADLQAAAEALGCTLAEIEAVVAKLQRLDPPGVFARDLKECLALQLADRNRLDPAMQALLDNLDLVARRDNTLLLKRCQVGAEDLAAMLAELRALNPKPGLVFDAEVPPPVVPDVFVRQHADGGWLVELNSETLPRLLVNERYHARVSPTLKSRAEKDYLAERLSSANWLVKSLDQRARTILRVAREIVRQQDAFLVHGVRQLRPLVLRDIAEAVQMHESTISRVTTNKYMATPRGIFELKYFFTSAIAATDGSETVSAEAVRHRIRQLVDEEDPDEVLSDDRLVEVLREEGVDIARRTVAKYREALRIPSSVQRRRDKKLFATV
jgi:RNA polymerase sigma-54 factor